MFGKKQILELGITGMTCDNCVRHVTDALRSVKGVVQADVSLEDSRATVTVRGDVDRDALVAAVAEAGYEAH